MRNPRQIAVTPMPFKDRRTLEDVIELRRRRNPKLRDKWCWGNRCKDTDWGGKGRRHLRSSECTPKSDSPLTTKNDARIKNAWRVEWREDSNLWVVYDRRGDWIWGFYPNEFEMAIDFAQRCAAAELGKF